MSALRAGRIWITATWREWAWSHRYGMDGHQWRVGPFRIVILHREVYMSRRWRPPRGA